MTTAQDAPAVAHPSHELARRDVIRIAEELGLTLESKFVPFSQSRNAEPRDGQKEPWRSLNWKVTLNHNGREVLRTDYSQGTAHCPVNARESKRPRSANRQGASAAMIRSAEALEIETGKRAAFDFMDRARETRHPIPGPDIADVLHSLALDSEVLEHSCFEDWAGCFGYDEDSRTAESTYRQCLEIALKMRGAIGNARLNELQEAAREM